MPTTNCLLHQESQILQAFITLLPKNSIQKTIEQIEKQLEIPSDAIFDILNKYFHLECLKEKHHPMSEEEEFQDLSLNVNLELEVSSDHLSPETLKSAKRPSKSIRGSLKSPSKSNSSPSQSNSSNFSPNTNSPTSSPNTNESKNQILPTSSKKQSPSKASKPSQLKSPSKKLKLESAIEDSSRISSNEDSSPVAQPLDEISIEQEPSQKRSKSTLNSAKRPSPRILPKSTTSSASRMNTRKKERN